MPISRPRLKELFHLRDGRTRRRLGLQLIEGPRLVTEALRAHRVDELFVATKEDGERWAAEAPGVTIHLLARSDLDRLADVKTPQDVLGIGPLPEFESPFNIIRTCPRILLLDRVQDPGNAGALCRSARALGLLGLLTTLETADLTAPKVLRGSAGALFFLRLGRIDAMADLLTASSDLPTLVVPSSRGGVDIREAKTPERFILVAGNEGGGSVVPDDPRVLKVTVPMAAGAESLNVAAACAAILARWLPPRGPVGR